MGRPDGAEADPSRSRSSDRAAPGSGHAEESERTREVDRWISDRLRQIHYDLGHPEAQQLADHLQALGIGTLVTLKNEGRLFAKCRSLVPGALPEPPPAWREESQRVIMVAVRMAVPAFITWSMRTWDPARSSIGTYFVNYCLLKFKTVYTQFCREEAQSAVETPTSDVVDLVSRRSAADDVEDLVVARETLREMTRAVGDREFAEYVRLALAGRTQAESAAALGISESTLQRRLASWRRTLGGRSRFPTRDRGRR